MYRKKNPQVRSFLSFVIIEFASVVQKLQFRLKLFVCLKLLITVNPHFYYLTDSLIVGNLLLRTQFQLHTICFYDCCGVFNCNINQQSCGQLCLGSSSLSPKTRTPDTSQFDVALHARDSEISSFSMLLF